MINRKFKKFLVIFLAVFIIVGGFIIAIKTNGEEKINAKENTKNEETVNSEVAKKEEIKNNDDEKNNKVETIDNEETNKKSSSSKNKQIGIATIDGVSIRSKNTSSSKYLGSLYTGDNVEIVGKTTNGWYKIKYKNSYAYVSSGFIKLAGTKTIDNELNTGTVYNTKKLAVRKSCTDKSKILSYLQKGQKVSIVRATSTNWYKIKCNNSYAYVDGKYIKLTKSTKNNTPSRRKNLNNFLFVGDSYTARLENTIKSRNTKVYVYAQSGSRSSYWLDKVDEMPNKNLIDSITILIGVNGVTTANNITNTKALLNELIVKYPDKTIYVQKVFPVGANFTEGNVTTYNKAIFEYNKQLKTFCDTKSNIKIIDVTTNFVNSKGYLTNTSDGLHINEEKNNDFYNAIKNAENNK